MVNAPERYRFDVSLEDLQTFRAVAELGSFSKAAGLLNLSQPSISARVRRLEAKVGVRLLDRTTRKVELTQQGRRLYARSSETLANLHQLLREFTGEAAVRAREVHVAATMLVASVGLPRLLRAFHDENPGLCAAVHDRAPHEAIAEVVAGDCDLAVMALNTLRPGIRFEPLFEDVCVAVTQRDHRLMGNQTATLADILAEPLLVPRGHAELFNAISAQARAQGLEVRLAPEAQAIQNTSTWLAWAVAGLGVCIHPRSLIPDRLEPGLGIVEIRDANIVRTFGLVTSEARPLGAAAKQFRNFMRAACRRPPPWQPEAKV
jgi:DNA-binding transcriptional LysR family regulator